MRIAARRFRADQGQSLVELALTLPLLLIILVGVAEFGHFAYASIEVSSAAQAAVQYGAQNHATASDNAGMQLAATQDGPNLTGLRATAQHFCQCSDASASTCSAGDCSNSRMIEFVQVNTTATVSPIFNYPGISKTMTLQGRAIRRVEQ